MTYNSVSFKQRRFPLIEIILHSPKWKNMLSPAFQNLKRSVVNSACYKFLAGASLHNDVVELDQMQVSIQGVQHDLWRIEHIASRLYKVKRRYQVCNTGTRKKEHEQTTTTSQTLFLQLGGTGTRCSGTKFNSCWHFCISWHESDQH